MTEPDVFIGYAHVDNAIFSSVKLGWVTQFENNLRKCLASLLDRYENIDV